MTNEFVEIQKLLKTGDLVKLRTGTIHGQRSYNGRVADICDDVVTVVVPEDSPLLMRGPGAFKVVMRKETDNALYIFDSSATVRFSHNRPNLKLRIESEVQRVQRRWNVRLSVLIDPEEALLIDGDEEKPFKATILDLSAGGVLLHTSEPIATGAKLRLSFPLPGLSRTIRANAEVVRQIRLDADGWQYLRLGARFLDLGKDQEDAIIRFAFHEQLKRRRLGR
ncbi:MAG: flagellar brake protein [Chloroflexota bacterium]